jgi:hypothetical protein
VKSNVATDTCEGGFNLVLQLKKGDKVYHVYKGGVYVEAVIKDIQDDRYVVVDLPNKKRKTFIPFRIASQSLVVSKVQARRLAARYRRQSQREWIEWITGRKHKNNYEQMTIFDFM